MAKLYDVIKHTRINQYIIILTEKYITQIQNNLRIQLSDCRADEFAC